MPGRRIRATPPGVLRTPPGDALELRRWDPSPAAAPYVAWCWAVRWDLRGRPDHRQATIPHPSAHLVVEDGAAWLHGPPRTRFERTLSGTGRAVGVRFRPGGVRPLLGTSVAAIADRRLPAAALNDLDGESLVRAVDAEADLDAAVARLEAALISALPHGEPDPDVVLADRAVTLLAEERSIATAAALAERLHVSVRSLHRLFAEYVGLGPAWVIRRHRLQDAAAAATGGEPVDWARLAADLGYADQAHLVRDFTATIGESPARYLSASRAPGRSARTPPPAGT